MSLSQILFYHDVDLECSGVMIGVGFNVTGFSVGDNVFGMAKGAYASLMRVHQELFVLVKAAITNLPSEEYLQILTGFKISPDKPLTYWANDPKFVHVLYTIKLASSVASDSSDGAISVRLLLKAASSPDAVMDATVTGLIGKLSTLLLLPMEDIDSKKLIVAYRLDSLVAAEFRNWITVELEAKVPVMELMNSPSIEHLARKIVSKSKLMGKVAAKENLADEQGSQKVEEVAQNE